MSEVVGHRIERGKLDAWARPFGSAAIFCEIDRSDPLDRESGPRPHFGNSRSNTNRLDDGEFLGIEQSGLARDNDGPTDFSQSR
jgi:hypothetical protein